MYKLIFSFRYFLSKIASKRADMSTDDISGFEDYLIGNVNEGYHKTKIENSIKAGLESINEATQFTTKFDDWLSFISKEEWTVRK